MIRPIISTAVCLLTITVVAAAAASFLHTATPATAAPGGSGSLTIATGGAGNATVRPVPVEPNYDDKPITYEVDYQITGTTSAGVRNTNDITKGTGPGTKFCNGWKPYEQSNKHAYFRHKERTIDIDKYIYESGYTSGFKYEDGEYITVYDGSCYQESDSVGHEGQQWSVSYDAAENSCTRSQDGIKMTPPPSRTNPYNLSGDHFVRYVEESFTRNPISNNTSSWKRKVEGVKTFNNSDRGYNATSAIYHYPGWGCEESSYWDCGWEETSEWYQVYRLGIKSDKSVATACYPYALPYTLGLDASGVCQTNTTVRTKNRVTSASGKATDQGFSYQGSLCEAKWTCNDAGCFVVDPVTRDYNFGKSVDWSLSDAVTYNEGEQRIKNDFEELPEDWDMCIHRYGLSRVCGADSSRVNGAEAFLSEVNPGGRGQGAESEFTYTVNGLIPGERYKISNVKVEKQDIVDHDDPWDIAPDRPKLRTVDTIDLDPVTRTADTDGTITLDGFISPDKVNFIGKEKNFSYNGWDVTDPDADHPDRTAGRFFEVRLDKIEVDWKAKVRVQAEHSSSSDLQAVKTRYNGPVNSFTKDTTTDEDNPLEYIVEDPGTTTVSTDLSDARCQVSPNGNNTDCVKVFQHSDANEEMTCSFETADKSKVEAFSYVDADADGDYNASGDFPADGRSQLYAPELRLVQMSGPGQCDTGYTESVPTASNGVTTFGDGSLSGAPTVPPGEYAICPDGFGPSLWTSTANDHTRTQDGGTLFSGDNGCYTGVTVPEDDKLVKHTTKDHQYHFGYALHSTVGSFVRDHANVCGSSYSIGCNTGGFPVTITADDAWVDDNEPIIISATRTSATATSSMPFSTTVLGSAGAFSSPTTGGVEFPSLPPGEYDLSIGMKNASWTPQSSSSFSFTIDGAGRATAGSQVQWGQVSFDFVNKRAIDGECGSQDGQNVAVSNISGVSDVDCRAPTGVSPTNFASTSDSWTWTCQGKFGGSATSCEAFKKIDGSCGPNDFGGPFDSLSSGDADNCDKGTVSGFGTDGTDGWEWTCAGINGGADSRICTADVTDLTASCTLRPDPQGEGIAVTGSTTVVGGSGSYSYIWSNGDVRPTTDHVFSTPGTHSLDVTVNDDTFSALSHNASCDVEIKDLRVSCSVSNTNPNVAETVTFTGSASGNIGVVTYDWDFDDGNVASGNPVDHAYNSNGSYKTVVTANDHRGQVASTTCPSVNVTPVPCGPNNGGDFYASGSGTPALSSGDPGNCTSAGTEQNFDLDQSAHQFTWECAPGGAGGPGAGATPASCQADQIVDGACGANNGANFDSNPTGGADQCAEGTEHFLGTTSSGWEWECRGINGGSDSPTCSANKNVDGKCGAPPHNADLTSLTESGVNGTCDRGSYQTGSFSTTTNAAGTTTGWSWTCEGAFNGSDQSCEADHQIIPTCGAPHGQDRYGPLGAADVSCDDGTYKSGSFGVDADNKGWHWKCEGINGGGEITCNTNKKIDGQCGDADGGTFVSTPTNNRCDFGKLGSGPPGAFSWSCDGINGGNNVTCNADELGTPSVTVSTGATCGGKVDVSWTAVSNADGYELYRNGSFLVSLGTGTSSTSYTDPAPSPGSTPTYKVVAFASNYSGRVETSDTGSAVASEHCAECDASVDGKTYDTLASGSCTHGTVTSFATTSSGWTWECHGKTTPTTDSCSADVSSISASCSASPDPQYTAINTTFNSTVSGGSGSYTYAWGNGGTGSSVTESYTATGTQTMALTVTDAKHSANTASTSCDVSITDLNVQCEDVSPTQPGIGETVTFNATSDNVISSVSYTWDFGNFSAGSGNPAYYAYSSYGTNTPSVSATTPEGATGSDICPDVIVTDVACGPNDTGSFRDSGISDIDPQNCDVGTTHNFSSTTRSFTWECVSSTTAGTVQCDADRVVDGTCGSPPDGIATTSLTESHVDGTCDQGTYATTSFATTTDADGNPDGWDWSCDGFNGGNTDNCHAAKRLDGKCGSNHGGGPFDALASSSADNCAQGTVANFGDTADGWGWVCSGENGGATSSQCGADITPIAVDCSTSPDPQGAGLDVTFSASTSGGSGNYSWSWSNGDTGDPVTDSFNAPGTHSLSVTATDDEHTNNTDTDSCSVVIRDMTVRCIDVSTTSPDIGDTVIFTATATDEIGFVDYDWAFGDGTTVTGTSSIVSHTYGSQGSYTATATGTDSVGQTGMDTCTPVNVGIDAECGTNSGGGPFSSLASSSPNNCADGSVVNFSTSTNADGIADEWTWECSKGSGSPNASCAADRSVVGECGTPDGGSRYAPLSVSDVNCDIGQKADFGTTTDAAGDADGWEWECRGMNGGASSTCRTERTIDGACGDNHGEVFDASHAGDQSGNCLEGSQISSTGTDSFTSTADGWGWTCYGQHGGTNISCNSDELNAPTVTATPQSCGGGIELSWTDVDHEMGYDIYRDGTLVTSVGAGTTNYSDPGAGLTDGTRYDYEIEAFAGNPNGQAEARSAVDSAQAPYACVSTECSASPDPQGVGLDVTFSASSSGGSGSYDYAWDSDDDGSYGDESGNQDFTRTYGSSGNYSVNLEVSDSANTSNSDTATCDVDINELTVSCDVSVSGECGSNDGGTFYADSISADHAANCDVGEAQNFNHDATAHQFTWECKDPDNPGNVPSCGATERVAGTCGSNDGGTFSGLSANKSGNCASGTVNNFATTSEGWEWTCEPINGVGPEEEQCSADMSPVTVSCSPGRGSTAVNDSVSFGATVSGGSGNYSYDWDLNGDGVNESSGATPSYSYSGDGEYQASVTVTDTEITDNSASAVCPITIEEPELFCGVSKTNLALGENVTFVASTTNILGTPRYQWDFDIGTASTLGRIATFSYGSKGTYEATVEIGTRGRKITTTCQPVNVDQDPVCGAANGTTTESLSGGSSDLCSTGNSQNFVSGTDEFSWECELNGDIARCEASHSKDADCGPNATGPESHLTADNASNCTVGTVKNFEATADGWRWTCTGLNGGADTQCSTPVTDVSARCSPDPSTQGRYLPVTFESTITDGSGPYIHGWDLTGDNVVDSVEPTPVKRFTEGSGSYASEVTVTDMRHTNNSDTAMCPVSIDELTVSCNVGPTVVNAGNGVTMSASTDGALGTTDYIWSFGDGNDGAGSSVSHSYSDSGLYDVTLTVTTSEGQFKQVQCSEVQVTPSTSSGGKEVDYSANSSGAVNPPPTYEWDFDGDGAVDTNGQSVSKTYNTPGEYEAILEGNTTVGQVASATCPIVRVDQDGVCGGDHGTFASSTSDFTADCQGADENGDPISPTNFRLSGNEWLWECGGIYGGATTTCSVSRMADGACGTNDGATLATLDRSDSNNCSTGPVQDFADTGGGWEWDCGGINGGDPAGGDTAPSCSATQIVGATPPSCESLELATNEPIYINEEVEWELSSPVTQPPNTQLKIDWELADDAIVKSTSSDKAVVQYQTVGQKDVNYKIKYGPIGGGYPSEVQCGSLSTDVIVEPDYEEL